MEGCLAGALSRIGARRARRARGPCGALARTHPVKVVFGPGTFINESAVQIGTRPEHRARRRAATGEHRRPDGGARRAASVASVRQATKLGTEMSQLIISQAARQLLRTGVQYGLTSLPSIDDQSFVSRLVCASATADEVHTQAALRLPVPQREYGDRHRAPEALAVRVRAARRDPEIRRAVAMPDWGPREGESYLVTGEPVIVADLTGAITSSLRVLLLAGLLIMTATLALTFQRRPRLLPLAIALAGDGDHVRRARAERGVDHDGLDRRAAGPARTRRRLRRPVPVARRRGAACRSRRRCRRGRARCGARRPDDRHGGGGDGRGFSCPAPLTGADGQGLRGAARPRHRRRPRCAR